MKVLDLFCCEGGAGVGYHRAGFDVVGVDIVPRPRYPFPLVQADAMDYVLKHGEDFDFIHASPPCQRNAAITKGTNRHRQHLHTDLYPDTLDALKATGRPYVIENPESCPDVVLCGEMFGLGVIRHRKFELGGWTTSRPAHVPHRGRVRGWRHGTYYDGPYVAAYGKGGGKATVAEMQTALGIDWIDGHKELTEAIPPAYTEWVGQRFIEGACARNRINSFKC